MRFHVIAALVCDELRRPGPESTVDYVGVRDFVVLPPSGSVRLSGVLVLKLYAPEFPAFDYTPKTAKMEVTLIEPSGQQLGQAATLDVVVDQRNPIARLHLDLSQLAVSRAGLHIFQVLLDDELLTVVPLMVVPESAIAGGPPSATTH